MDTQVRLTTGAGSGFKNGDMWIAYHLSGIYSGYLVLIRTYGFRDVSGQRCKILLDQRFQRCQKTIGGQRLSNRERVQKESPMKVIVINPTELPKLVEIDGSLESLQKLVGGYLEALPFTTSTTIFIDEDPQPAINLVATRLFNHMGPGLLDNDYIRGPMIIVGCLNDHGEYDGEEHDVPEDVVEKVLKFGL